MEKRKRTNQFDRDVAPLDAAIRETTAKFIATSNAFSEVTESLGHMKNRAEADMHEAVRRRAEFCEQRAKGTRRRVA